MKTVTLAKRASARIVLLVSLNILLMLQISVNNVMIVVQNAMQELNMTVPYAPPVEIICPTLDV